LKTQTQTIDSKQNLAQAQADNEVLQRQDLPNSTVVSLFSQAGAQDGDSGGDINSLKNTLMGRFTQRVQPQIPSAEREASMLSSGVNNLDPESVKAEMGSRLGADFSGINFHVGNDAAGRAASIGARAYTIGRDVHFGEGGFDSGIAAHELVHTVQQGAVDSSVSTVSAPMGGVQMWPDIRSWFRRKAKDNSEQTLQTGGINNPGYNPPVQDNEIINPIFNQENDVPVIPGQIPEVDGNQEPVVPQVAPQPPGVTGPQNNPPGTVGVQAQETMTNELGIRGQISKLKDSKKSLFLGFNSSTYNNVQSAIAEVNIELNKSAAENYQENCKSTIEKYEKLIKSCEDYLKKREGASTSEGKARLELVRETRDMAREDIAGLVTNMHVSPLNNANAKMSDVVGEVGRSETINLDDGRDITTVGNVASSRMVFTHKDQNVFFTKETILKDEEGNKDEAVKHVDDNKKGQYRLILDMSIADDTCWAAKEADLKEKKKNNLIDEESVKDAKILFVEEMFKDAPKNEFDFSNKAECLKLFDFLVEANKEIIGKNTVKSNAAMSENQSISGRNAAMSRVAKLLGVSDVIAESKNAKIIQDGKTKRGNIMVEAKGESPLEMKEKGDLQKTDVSSGELQRQLVNLQLLDTLCGQTDRHLGNYFMQQENGRATGITAIDNDIAFGKKGSSKSATPEGEKMHNPQGKLSPFLEKGSEEMNLPVVDEDVAYRIINLDPKTLLFAVSDIVTDEDDRAALLERLTTMQKALKVMEDKNKKAGAEKMFLQRGDWGTASHEALMRETQSEHNASTADIKFYHQNYYRRLVKSI
jgi:hypothetical protein